MKDQIVDKAHSVILGFISNKEPIRKTALLLNALPPEVIVEISRDFTEREIQTILPVMTRLPLVWTIETVAVIDEFLRINSLWDTVGKNLREPADIIDAFVGWARQNPRQISIFFRIFWLEK